MNTRILACVAAVVFAGSLPAADLPGNITGKDGSTMLLVPAGDFIMGTAGDRDDATPPHRRDLPAFYIDQTEVTVEQYTHFLNDTGHPAPPDWVKREGKYVSPEGKDKRPITNITWFDAMRYAVWAGKRLPTEPEWEKAARGTDGRLYPWGNTDDPARRHLTDEGTSSTFHDVEQVGRFPAGASPFGCLDMSGNAWEWTADWYDKYPGTSARSVHFGQQYKVMRGGSGLAFYGVPNTGTCVQRARLVPYGAYDSLGFRCVIDPERVRPPYDAGRLLKEAEEQLQGTLKAPAQLSYEKEFDRYREAARVPLTVTGAGDQRGHVRTGFPLPEGMMKDTVAIGLIDQDGKNVPVQASVLSRWKDGSVRWALLDFAAAAGDSYQVALHEGGATQPRSTGWQLEVDNVGEGVAVRTGKAAFQAGKDGLTLRGALLGRMSLSMTLQDDDALVRLEALPAEKVEVEQSGPVHAVVRLQGGLAEEGGKPSAFRYDLRIHATAGSSRLNLLLTVVHYAARKLPFETVAPVIPVTDLRVSFQARESSHVVFGTDSGSLALPAAEPVELLQPDDLQYAIGAPDQRLAALPKADPNKKVEYLGEAKLATRPKETVEARKLNEREGTRAPGWMLRRAGEQSVLLGIRHFWQNCPKSLFSTPEAIGVRLWAGTEPFEWEAGLAKTHEIIIDFDTNVPGGPRGDAQVAVCLDPLRAVVAPAWLCGMAAAGAITPRTPESLQTFPYWEAWRETDMWSWANAMPAGFRDFGDGYMGGPYKGKNAYQNLEYDVPLNFLFQFMRTGQTWYLNAAEPMARHQADVDIDNYGGRQWKHSPQHTTWEAEFGHVFCRGLLLHYLLTGERRSLEAAMRIGDWMTPIVARGEGVGNERQIGWSLYALTGLYEVTREKRYLDAAEALCRRLMEGQEPTGKFAIRWDNRISFFNGIAMNGMLTVAEQTGDPQLAECVMKVARRTLGFYPEYAGRTLNAFCWALEQTNDARYLDAMRRAWNSTMEFLMDRNVESEETHAWKFPRFAARYRLFSIFEGDSPALPDAATWRSLRLRTAEATVYVRPAPDKVAAVLVIREGLDAGKAEVLDSRGGVVQTTELHDTGRFFEAVAISLPSGTGSYLLRMTSRKAFAWQVQHDAAASVVVLDSAGVQLPHIMPRAFCSLRDGADGVKVRLQAVGEGFHSATLYDPEGRPVSTVRHFIDFGDVNRYELELKAGVTGARDGWSLELCNVKVLTVEGLLPYYATSPDNLFNPER